jgi:hypothetical protein
MPSRKKISYPASAASVVFGRRLSARFPCPAGQEIARNPPLRGVSYVSVHFENKKYIK